MTYFYLIMSGVVMGLIAAVLVVRFLNTGGPAMLRMMSAPSADGDQGHHH